MREQGVHHLIAFCHAGEGPHPGRSAADRDEHRAVAAVTRAGSTALISDLEALAVNQETSDAFAR
jgi:hypothetical protein